MKYFAFILLFCSTLFAADAPVTITPGAPGTNTCVITVNVADTSVAVKAASDAYDAAVTANAIPNAVQQDANVAASNAYAKALIPQMYKLVELVQTATTKSNADVDAMAAKAKADVDAQAAALKAMRPAVVGDPTK